MVVILVHKSLAFYTGVLNTSLINSLINGISIY